MTRTEKQEEIQELYRQNNGRGFLSAPTGFGKTWVGVNAAKGLFERNPNRIVHVIVPRTPLVTQWKDEFKQLLSKHNIQVFTVQKYIRMSKEERTCDLLIGDEGHWYTNEKAEIFRKVLGESSWRFVLVLSASFTYDQKLYMQSLGIPELATITLAEARKYGWVAAYREFNLGIELLEEERKWYNEISKKIGSVMPLFRYDLDRMRNCDSSLKPRFGRFGWFDPPAVEVARENGWQGNSAKYVGEHRGTLEELWGNPDHDFAPKKIAAMAHFAMKAIYDRRMFLINYERKAYVAKRIIDAFPQGKIITFGESIKLADMVAELVGEDAVVYHSGVESLEKEETIKESRKSRKGADSLARKKNGTVLEKDGEFIVSYKKLIKYSPKTIKQRALRMIADNRFRKRVLCSAKALDEGLDIPDLEIAIQISRTQNPRVNIQRAGRVARLFTYKDGSQKAPIVFNIYIKDTKDEKWLKSSQRDSVGVKEISDVSDVFNEEEFEFM